MKIKVVSKDKIEEVQLTQQEVDEINSNAEVEKNIRIANHIIEYRNRRSIEFPYKTTVMRLTDGARADISAVYFAVTLNTSITDNTVMMVWQETGYDDLPITAGDLRADGLSFMNHRQKCFTVASIVKTAHEQTPYESKDAVETAFDTAYDNN